jgi:hypothetical protein
MYTHQQGRKLVGSRGQASEILQARISIGPVPAARVLDLGGEGGIGVVHDFVAPADELMD